MSEKERDNAERWETNGYNAAMFRQHGYERPLLIGGGSTKKVNKLLFVKKSAARPKEIGHAFFFMYTMSHSMATYVNVISELTSTLNLRLAHMEELRVFIRPRTAAPIFQNRSCVSNCLIFMVINLRLSMDRSKAKTIHSKMLNVFKCARLRTVVALCCVVKAVPRWKQI